MDIIWCNNYFLDFTEFAFLSVFGACTGVGKLMVAGY
jgi:hypothetical protein